MKLPVVDDVQLVGIVTDRDMFIALGTRNTRAAHLRVGAVVTTKVSTCGPDDEVEALNDIALAAGDNRSVRDQGCHGPGDRIHIVVGAFLT